MILKIRHRRIYINERIIINDLEIGVYEAFKRLVASISGPLNRGGMFKERAVNANFQLPFETPRELLRSFPYYI